MSVSEFEEQVLTYVWRAVVLAGLITVLGSAFVPPPNPKTQEQAGDATSASARVTARSAPANAAQ